MGNTFSLSGPFLVVIRALRIIYADMGLIAVYVAVEAGPPLWHVSISTGGSKSKHMQKHNHVLMFSELFSQTQPPRWCFSTRAFLGSTFHVSNLQGPPPRDYDDKLYQKQRDSGASLTEAIGRRKSMSRSQFSLLVQVNTYLGDPNTPKIAGESCGHFLQRANHRLCVWSKDESNPTAATDWHDFPRNAGRLDVC